MIDNRDLEFCKLFFDREIKDFSATIWNRFNELCKSRPLREDEHGQLHCPGCWQLFSPEHAERKPNFCEVCGQALEWGDGVQVDEVNFFDEEEIHHGCTVQILTNSVTGKQSIGWWMEDSPPGEVGV